MALHLDTLVFLPMMLSMRFSMSRMRQFPSMMEWCMEEFSITVPASMLVYGPTKEFTILQSPAMITGPLTVLHLSLALQVFCQLCFSCDSIDLGVDCGLRVLHKVAARLLRLRIDFPSTVLYTAPH